MTAAFKAGLTFRVGTGADQILTATNTDDGSGYVANEVITLAGGGTGGTIRVLTIGGGGEIVTFAVLAGGTGYAIADALTQGSTSGVGTGATFTVATVQEVTAVLEEVKSVSGFGKTNELVDVTNFSSPNNTKEYIAGLADGAEISVECNKLNTGATVQNQLIADVDAQESARFIRITWTDGTTSKTYSFNVVCLSYTYAPSIADANKISYTLKITGDITTV